MIAWLVDGDWNEKADSEQDVAMSLEEMVDSVSAIVWEWV